MWVIAGIITAYIWILFDKAKEEQNEEESEFNNPKVQKAEKVVKKAGFTKRKSGPEEVNNPRS